MFNFLKKAFGKKVVENEVIYEPINESLVKVIKNGRVGIVGANPSECFKVIENGKEKLITEDGAYLIPLKFDSISFDGEGKVIAQNGEVKTVFTKVVVRSGDGEETYSFEEFYKVVGSF